MRSLTFLLALLLTSPLAADTLSPDQAVARTLRENPGLRAARWRIEEARGRVVGAGRLANPELDLSYSRKRGTSEYAGGIGLLQRFPVTARLSLERAVARAELVAAEAEVADGARRLALEARSAAIKLLAIQNLRALRERQLQNSRDLSDQMQRRAQVGEASSIESLQTDLEARQLAAEASRLEFESATLLGELRILLGLPRNAPIAIAGTLDGTGTSVRSGNPSQRADLRASAARVESATQATSLARAERWEDFSISLGIERGRTEDAPFGLERETTATFKLGIPLPVWNQGQGKILTAAAALRRTQLELSALEARVPNEIGAAQREEAAAIALIGTFERDLLPMAQRIEDQLRNALGSGQTSLIEVLRARGKRFELEAQRLDVQRDRQLARARLLAASGADTPATLTTSSPRGLSK
ncbi:MAG: TolC family protein [Verrucomicrobia bacterium]|nr:TolC family protein [Verrucomicrobiota bacterium]